MHPLLTWPFLPVAFVQAMAVRRRIARMLPAPGPHEGAIPGTGEPVRLLVLGDSSAAGVGVVDMRDSLAGHLARLVAENTGRPVAWRAAGFNSATSGQIRDHVIKHLPRDGFSHVVLTVGTNDAKNFHAMGRVKKEFGGLAYALRARFPSARIVWSPVIDMRTMPALPPFLARLLESRASAFNSLCAGLADERGLIAASRLEVRDPSGFAEDGFHAGPGGCRVWAEHLLPFVIEQK